ncbi:FG-GAP repeat domain-containing protein [Streptomyces sp. QHH-9511]|uniref:FG-GAP repeat domain-containing protein n=1 Tax=Streptomyces sp. QHH-9511 TaxID=2684468 RepID=UPI002FCD55D8
MHSKRARRIAACTALVLSAGMLLAAPATADEPSPRSAAEKPEPTVPLPAKPDLSKLSASEGAGSRADASGATVVSPLRSDLDGDGSGDLILRESGIVFTSPSTADSAEFYLSDNPTDFPKDIIPIGDQDGTGSPEVLTLSQYGKLSLYREANASGGNYSWSGNGWNIYNKVFSPGDVNGDQKPDLMARQTNGDLYLYLASGSAGSPFHARVRIGSGWNIYDQVVGAGDNNGDGLADVIGRTPNGSLYFYGGTGSTTAPFKPRQGIGTGWQTYNQIIGMDDVTGDGNAELFARDQAGVLWGYEGTGTAGYAPRVRLGEGWESVDQFGGAGSIPVFGKNELLARDGQGRLYWYYALNDGKLSPRVEVGEGWGGANITNVSSLDQDGYADLLEIYQGHLYNNQTGTDFGGGWGVYNLMAGPGDLSGDGRGDLLARDGSGNLYVYRGNGNGTAFQARIKVGSGWNAYNRILGAGDYTGDGLTDLVARTAGGDLYLYAGTGQAAAPFKSRLKIGSGWQTYGKLVAPGDLNGDGKGDLLGVTSAGDLYRYYSTGTGAFGPRVKIGTGFQVYNGLY